MYISMYVSVCYMYVYFYRFVLHTRVFLPHRHMPTAISSAAKISAGKWGRPTVWPEKNRQMSIKVAQNDFTRKMIDFDTFRKIA